MWRPGCAMLGMFLLSGATVHAQEGAAGIEAARQGGVVIACRHAITDPADEDETTLRYDDPSTQRRLSARGERQSEAMGEAFRALDVPVAEVIASPMQRARLTAELAFGEVVLDSAWHTRGEYFGGWKRTRRLDQLGRRLPGRGNRVIVSHIGTMYSVIPSIRHQLDEGDCAVLRPLGGERFDVIDVAPWRAWLRAAGLNDDVRREPSVPYGQPPVFSSGSSGS